MVLYIAGTVPFRRVWRNMRSYTMFMAAKNGIWQHLELCSFGEKYLTAHPSMGQFFLTIRIHTTQHICLVSHYRIMGGYPITLREQTLDYTVGLLSRFHPEMASVVSETVEDIKADRFRYFSPAPAVCKPYMPDVRKDVCRISDWRACHTTQPLFQQRKSFDDSQSLH